MIQKIRAIGKVNLNKRYSGNTKLGEVVSVLLPSPIDSNIWIEDTEIVSLMRIPDVKVISFTCFTIEKYIMLPNLHKLGRFTLNKYV